MLGVRPEHLRVSTDRSANSLPAEVAVVEDLGNERLIDTRVEGQGVIARQASDSGLEMGDRVYLNFEFGDAHLFDPVTERHLVKPA
jgi:ABC-type sugar transport system ATPase subunit